MFYYVIISVPLLLYFFKIVLTNFIIPYYRKKALYLKLKEEPDWPRIDKLEKILNHIYRRSSGKFISKMHRATHCIRNKELIYGEIHFLSFYTILKKAEPKEGDVFYDLGSGTGKAVFCAALFLECSQVKGIELLFPLCKKANSFLNKARQLYETNQNTELHSIKKIEFINDNFLDYDFLDADIIYIAATCLNHSTWQQLITKMSLLKPGSRIIVASKSIQHPGFKTIYHSVEIMSWGLCPVFIYKIVSDDKARIDLLTENKAK